MIIKNINILSIEDNPGDFLMLKEVLSEAPDIIYNVTNCQNLTEGIELLKTGQFDIILLDLSLPDSKGLNSLARIKEICDEKPVIVMTGNNDNEIARQAIHEGAQDFLIKGHFDFSLISKAISYSIERKELEGKIKDSEKLYRDLIEFSPDAILIHHQGIIEYVNSSAQALLGASSKSDLVGLKLYSIIDPSYHAFVNERIEKLEKGDVVGMIEEKLIRLDGKQIFVEIISSPITFKNKRAIQSIARDITEKINAVESFAQQSKLNYEMAELASNMLKAKSLDEITEITLEKAQQLTKSKFGFVAYIDPKTGFMVVPTLSHEIWNECKVERKSIVFEKFTGLWGWVLIHKQSLMTNQAQKDYRSAGTPVGHVKIDRIISVPAMHHKQLIGQITLANSETDYTDHDLIAIERLAAVFALGVRRIQAVNEVIEREERFGLAFQYSNIGSIIVGLDKRLLKVNSTFLQMLGYTEDEMLQKSFDDLTYPEDLSIGQEDFNRMLLGAIDYSVNQKRYMHKDGHIIRAYVSSTLLRNTNGQPMYFITHIQDFTEKIEAEEKVKKSLSEKEALIKELFHRTKNNMQIICSMMELKASTLKDPQYVAMLKEMENRIQTMSLVQEKLYQTQNLSRIDLKDYLNDLVIQLFMRFNVSSEKIELKLELENISVLIDTAIPCGIFINELVSNAFKYAFPGDVKGELKVSLKSPSKDLIELKVADNGIGLNRDIEEIYKNSLGMMLLHSIAKDQLQGEINFKTENGFSCSVIFKDTYYSERI